MATRGNEAERLAWKVRLVRNLYECGLNADDVRELFRLIDWMMDLPCALYDLFWEEADNIAKEKHMPFIDIAERKNREKGLRQGVLTGIQPFLKAKFPEHWEQLLDEIRQVQDLTVVQAIPNAIQSAATPEELRRVWSK